MTSITEQHLNDAQTLWDYHQLHHEPRPTDVAIGLGSHDLGVAIHAANLYHQGRFPLIVFSGANAPTTVERFPDGAAVHYTREATARGVPADHIRTDARATNTAENILFTRDLLAGEGIRCTTDRRDTRPDEAERCDGGRGRVVGSKGATREAVDSPAAACRSTGSAPRDGAGKVSDDVGTSVPRHGVLRPVRAPVEGR